MPVDALTTLRYETDGRIARITLDRPARGNGITPALPGELSHCVERANLDPAVHVIALSGNGSGFCGGYDLEQAAENLLDGGLAMDGVPPGSPLDPAVQARNHRPDAAWDPTVDYAMMHRFVRGFMSLFHSEKPVICKVHGYCVAGGTDLALCADLMVIADNAKFGYPPARVWGVPTTGHWLHRLGAERAKRLLFTGDCITGAQAAAWGLASECAPPDQLDERFERLLERVARLPVNQLVMMKLMLNQGLLQQGLAPPQLLSVFFDGIARHTPEGHAFRQRAAETGFREAVRERDAPFGDYGLPNDGSRD